MVLSLKTWKSRSLPGLPRTDQNLFNDEWCIHTVHERPPAMAAVLFVELPSANSETAAVRPAAVFCCGIGGPCGAHCILERNGGPSGRPGVHRDIKKRLLVLFQGPGTAFHSRIGSWLRG